ncbi:MAG: efflux RND transporter permease subunit [Sulfuricaulis sp.]
MSSDAASPLVRYRFFITLVILAVLLLGFFALGRLSIDLPTARNAPRLHVQVSVPGVSATVIENTITPRLEEAVTGVAGVTAVESVTTSGNAYIDLYLKHRHETAAVLRDVSARLQSVKSSWPISVDPPTLSVIDTSSNVAEFAITSSREDMLTLRDWTEGEFASQLRELSGVATVEIQGGAVHEVLVMPDQRRLAGLGLSFGDVLQAIRKAPEADAGIHTPPVMRSRREKMPSGNAAAVAAMPVMLPSGESLPLAEIAQISLTEAASTHPFRFEGAPAIKVIVQKKTQVAASDIVGRIQAHLEWMRANRLIPGDIEIHLVSKRLKEAQQSLREIAYALVAGFFLVVTTALLLLGSGRRTLIIGITVVTVLQSVFVVLASANLALDARMLSGLAIGIGLFAGIAMLMFENTPRSVTNQANYLRPIITMAVVVPAALLPVLFMGGEIRALFREFVTVFGGAWLLCVCLALLLVPAFDGRRRQRAHARWNMVVNQTIVRLRQFYSDQLRRFLRHPNITLIVAVILVGVMTAALFMHRQVFPPLDDRRVEDIILRVQGPDFGQLKAVGDDIVQRLRHLSRLDVVKNTAQAYQEVLSLQMDEARAHELGVDMSQAGQALAIAVSGIPVGSFRDAEHSYDIYLRLPPEESSTTAILGRVLLLGELDNRPAVHIHDIATVERVTEPAQIRRYDGKPMIEVTASPASGSSMTQAWVQVQTALKNYALPAGYQLFFGAHGEAAKGGRVQGAQVLGWALFLVFVAQALLHRSIRMAMLLTLTGLSALGGAGIASLFIGSPLSASVWIGALMLVGITTGYAVVPVTQIGTLGEAGTKWKKKIVQYAKHQFRPQLAATLLAQLGMLPLLWTHSDAAVLHPLVVVLLIGLLFSFFINLFLTPLLYLLIMRTD